ncbi:MAG: peptidylprolyl isomerase, partial [bacterium]
MKKHVFLLLLLAGALALRCSGDVIAKAKGFMFTVEDLKFEIRKMGPSSRYEDTFEGRKAAVGAIWVRRMLADEAERLGLIDKDEIERKMKEAEERQVQEVYHRWKIENRAKVPRIKTKDIRTKLSRRLHLKDVVSRTYKGAEDLVSYLSAGADFDSLALRLEGREDFAFRDIGWVLWKEINAEIGCKVFTLLPGEFSGIIRLNDGYHIFLVAEDERFDLNDEIISQRSKRIAKMLETERLVDLERREIGAKYGLRFDQRGIMDALKAFSSSFSGERPDESLFESTVAVWKGGELYVADLFQHYYSLPQQSRLYIGDEHGMIELAYEILMPKLEAQAGYDMGID